jgi:hypothetical protein
MGRPCQAREMVHMIRWHQSTGHRPSELRDDDRIFVRLRNGREPKEPWPVKTTVWRGRGDFDVVEWGPA